MPIDVRSLLTDREILDEQGNQNHPISREDILYIQERNGGKVSRLDFSGLKFTGADLRGLNFRRSRFYRCDFTGVIATPIVVENGREWPIGDGATDSVVEAWANGEPPCGVEVTPASFEMAFFTGGTLDRAHFRYAELKGAHLNSTSAHRTDFFAANLKKANFRFADFQGVDLRSADLRKSNLFGLQLETPYLENVNWGRKCIVSHEEKEHWDEAKAVYRMLARAHELAGLNEVAREFRYRFQKALTGEVQPRWRVRARNQEIDNSTISTRLERQNDSGWTLGIYLGRVFLDCLFGYGERPRRVLGAITLTILAFTVFYFECSTLELTASGFREFGIRFVHALYFSVASSTALGYGSWVGQTMGWTKYIGVVQSFIGTFLNALLLVTFFRKWT